MFQNTSYAEPTPSTLRLAVTNILLNDYATLVILTAIGYDFILTLSDEAEYIWNRPWTRVSIVFILIRYFGLCSVIISALGLLKSSRSGFARLTLSDQSGKFFSTCLGKGGILGIFASWTVAIFFGAADLVMILSVWALYNPSRLILGALLTLYAIEVVLNLVFCILLSTRTNPPVFAAQILDYSFCTSQLSASFFANAVDAVQLALSALMCLLVSVQFIWQSLQVYKATGRFQLGRYMNLLAREVVFYFLAVLSRTLFHVLHYYATSVPSNGWWTPLSIVPQFVPTFVIVPRFILSLRKMYACDYQCQHGGEIGTGFALTWAPCRDAATSVIMFAHGGCNEESEQEEEMSMKADGGV